MGASAGVIGDSQEFLPGMGRRDSEGLALLAGNVAR